MRLEQDLQEVYLCVETCISERYITKINIAIIIISSSKNRPVVESSFQLRRNKLMMADLAAVRKR